jgi:hypothetical protein
VGKLTEQIELGVQSIPDGLLVTWPVPRTLTVRNELSTARPTFAVAAGVPLARRSPTPTHRLRFHLERRRKLVTIGATPRVESRATMLAPDSGGVNERAWQLTELQPKAL